MAGGNEMLCRTCIRLPSMRCCVGYIYVKYGLHRDLSDCRREVFGFDGYFNNTVP